jgi:hypothetical protein
MEMDMGVGLACSSSSWNGTSGQEAGPVTEGGFQLGIRQQAFQGEGGGGNREGRQRLSLDSEPKNSTLWSGTEWGGAERDVLVCGCISPQAKKTRSQINPKPEKDKSFSAILRARKPPPLNVKRRGLSLRSPAGMGETQEQRQACTLSLTGVLCATLQIDTDVGQKHNRQIPTG